MAEVHGSTVTAIGGVVHRDGSPVSPALLQSMLRGFEETGFGPAAAGARWLADAVGMVQAGGAAEGATARDLDRPTPPDFFTRGLRTVVADTRLDNRDELFRALGLPGTVDSVGNAELLLAAYERWGRGCAEHLLGDFAFAIWDAGQRNVYCARDHSGVKPLYYRHEPARRFAWASSLSVLAMLDGRRAPVNDRRVVDFLAGEHLDPGHTCYAGILRLPAAHWLVAGAAGLEYGRYWSPERLPTLRLASDAEYGEAFREVFTASVRCRMEGASAVASMLSGGLDSSSIVAVGRELARERGTAPLVTYSTVFPDAPTFDESRFIQQVVDGGGCSAHLIPFDHADHHPLGVLAAIQRFHGEPVFAPNASQPWQLMARLPSGAPRVVLDGHGGDETVSHGLGYFRELARAHRWVRLAGELRAGSDDGLYQAALLLGRYVGFGLEPQVAQSAVLRGVRRLWRGARRRVVRRGRDPASGHHGLGVLAPAQRRPFSERLRMARADRPALITEHDDHAASILDDARSESLEVLGAMGRGREVAMRFPFMDRRLVDLCLSLPAEQKRRNGWGRLVMRHAMAGLLPEGVRWRRDKVDFLANALRATAANDAGVLETVRSSRDRLAAYVDPRALDVLCARAASGVLTAQEYFSVVRITAVARWL
jgi:asparagine synthase (glutamine-hydrolysing)